MNKKNVKALLKYKVWPVYFYM